MPDSTPNNPSSVQSKKIHERRLFKKKNDESEEMLLDFLLRFYPDDSHKTEFLSPLRRADNRYVTSEKTLNNWIDLRIFSETQLKSVLRWLTTSPPVLRVLFSWLLVKKMGMKLAYFDQNEDKNPDKFYAKNAITEAQGDNVSIHNLGHATQLIQVPRSDAPGMNVLIDPVFGDLAPLIYPSMTKRFGDGYDIKANELPTIDVILISHNHRDHVDEASLKEIIKKAAIENREQPEMLVPNGDKIFFESLGFTKVREFEWHEQITLNNVTFCSAPADHRSGRTATDKHKSLVMGWTISPKDKKEILYFAGDTAKISKVRMTSLALDVYQLFQHKQNGIIKPDELPKIINLEPGGPNYTRKDMKPTHQSAVDSITSAFRLAVELEKVSEKYHHDDKKIDAQKWLDATATIFMHHNKFELGPDRFNENIFIFNRLLSYLRMDKATLALNKDKQQSKSKIWSLFHRRKDFIIEGVEDLQLLAATIWPECTEHEQKIKLIEFIEARTHFPLIRQKITSEEVYTFDYGTRSSIMPDTLRDESGRLKGEKEDYEHGVAPKM